MQNSDMLHELIETKSILRVGGAFDSMSAKLVEINKFDDFTVAWGTTYPPSSIEPSLINSELSTKIGFNFFENSTIENNILTLQCFV